MRIASNNNRYTMMEERVCVSVSLCVCVFVFSKMSGRPCMREQFKNHARGKTHGSMLQV